MKQLLFSLLVFSCFSLSGQSIGSYNLSPAGNSSMNESGGLYFALGEPMNTEIGSEDLMISQGFLQVAIQANLTNTYEILITTAKVYPNPVTESLTVEILQTQGTNEFILFNSNGQKMAGEILQNKQSTIDFTALQSGTYFLEVLTNTKSIGVYTIIKP